VLTVLTAAAPRWLLAIDKVVRPEARWALDMYRRSGVFATSAVKKIGGGGAVQY
jgi:hypothetical protein